MARSMILRRFVLLPLLLALACTAPNARQNVASANGGAAWAAACEDFDEWDKPGPPFRIHGNSWYVGTCGIAAVLVTGGQGHVLIDGGTEKGASIIAQNIRRLGFRLRDVKLLLHSHEHFDHVGGLSSLQRLTGARLVASQEAAPVLSTGRDGAGDPQAGMHPPFAAARVDAVLGADGQASLGALRLTAVPTPGHTPGALTWQWQSCASGNRDCRWIVYADSLNPISSDSYRFSAHPAYVAAFRAGLERLSTLNCDILLTPHPGSSDMRKRLLSPRGLAEAGGCRAYAAMIRERLDARLAKEVGPAPHD